MTRIYKFLLYSILITICSWGLPWILDALTMEKRFIPFTLYSGVSKSFAILNHSDSVKYSDSKGRIYSESEFDSILPTFYHKQLAAKNKLPDSLHGQAISSPMLSKEFFMFRSSPISINKTEPNIFQLMESKPRRLNMEMPNDIFRFRNNRIEFVDLSTNKVNEEKSRIYRDIFEVKGVSMPLRCINGDVSTRKEYDNGYMFIDNKGDLFHFKQIEGNPFLKKVELDRGIEVEQIYITEYPSRRIFAFICDKEERFYAINTPDYSIQEIPIHPFNPKRDNITIIGNYFDWNIQKNRNRDVFYYGIDAKSKNLLDTMVIRHTVSPKESLADYIFPYRLNFSSSYDRRLSPKIAKISYKSIFSGNLAAVVIFFAVSFFVKRRKKESFTKCSYIKGVLLFWFGILALIPFLLFDD